MTPGRDEHAKPDAHAHAVHGLVGLPDRKGPYHEQRPLPGSGPFGHEVKAPGRSARRRLPRPVTKLFLILA